MKILISMMLLAQATAGYAADTYKWVDEKGVVNYGEKPPATRPAKPVSTVGSPGTELEFAL